MKFKRDWPKEEFRDISEVIDRHVADDRYGNRGAIERVDDRVDSLLETVKRIAELLNPEQQKMLAKNLNFNVVE